MIITVRTMQVAPGKRGEAQDWTTRLAKYMRDKYPKHNFKLAEQVMGDHTILAWIGEFDNLVAYEAHLDKTAADATFQEFVVEQRKKLLFTTEKSTTTGFRVLVG